MNLDFQAIADHIHDGLYLLDKRRKITYWNQAAERITGYSSGEVLGRSCADNILVHVDSQGQELCRGLCPVAFTLGDGERRTAEVFLKHKQGHRVPVHVRVSPLRNRAGEIIGGIELFSPVKDQDAQAQRLRKLEQLALIDDLTQLPNRRYLNSELESRLNMYRREDLPFSVLFIDIDHFKQFNDRHGHHVGDEVLRAISQTAAEVIRSFDIIGRWGGEEFLGIFPNTRRNEMKAIGERLLALIRATAVECDDRQLQVTATMGGAQVRKQDSKESLIRRADQRMYQGKKAGRDRLVI